MNKVVKNIKKADYKKIVQIVLTVLMVASLIATPLLTVFAIFQSN